MDKESQQWNKENHLEQKGIFNKITETTHAKIIAFPLKKKKKMRIKESIKRMKNIKREEQILHV